MIKALLLVLEPVRTWEKLAQARRSMWFVMLMSLLPLLAFTGYGEYFALTHWGKYVADRSSNITKTPELALFYVGVQGGLSLLMVFGLAWIIRVVNQSFHGIAIYSECFSLVAYSLSPLFLARLIDMLPGIAGPFYIWLSTLIGFGMVLATFYNGLPGMLRLSPASAFGHYFIGILIMLVVVAFVRFCSITALALDKLPENLTDILPAF